MRKIWEKLRAPFCWDEIEFRPRNRPERPVIVQRNTITEATRWRYVTPVPYIPDDWKPGLPTDADCRLTPPSGKSSGVKFADGGPINVTIKDPQAFDRMREALRRASPCGATLEASATDEGKRPRRLSLTAAPKGGFIVGEEYQKFGQSFFHTMFAGDLTDCCNFMESEMEGEPC